MWIFKRGPGAFEAFNVVMSFVKETRGGVRDGDPVITFPLCKSKLNPRDQQFHGVFGHGVIGPKSLC